MEKIFLLFLLVVFISGCGGGSSSPQSIPEIPTPTQLPGLLVQIKTENDLVDSVKRGFKDELALGVVTYTHLRGHETLRYLVCRLRLEKRKRQSYSSIFTALSLFSIYIICLFDVI